MTRLAPLILSALGASLLVACVGTKTLEDGQNCPCAPGWSCYTPTNQCVHDTGGAGDAGGELPRNYDTAEVEAALAQCDLPHGPVATPETFGDKRALLVGAWIECPPSTMSVFTPALWFATNGTWNRLLFDGGGGLVVGYGVTNQGDYSFPRIDSDPVGSNNYTYVATASMNSAPSDYSSGPMTLETSPARMHTIITYRDETISVWLVRLP
jgi:hypothetical protein